MFKSTNDFFDLVRNGDTSQIDIEEYIYKKTKKHNIDKLTTLLKDLEFYLFVEKDILISQITPEMWEKKHKYYLDKGEQTPFKETSNILKILNKKKGVELPDEPDVIKYYCEETLFFPTEFYCIYQLKKYIQKLINNSTNKYSSHENIFSNNGFILFEHLLNQYVEPKGIKGRLSDIHYFYWKMYNNTPQLIHQRPEPFKKWFFENYEQEDLGKIKTLDQVKNSNREKHFSNALDWFKTQK